jgi:PAS domain S-box-containing protein
MAAVAVGFVAVILLGTRFLIRALREHRESEARFQQMASNIQEVFWMIDAESKKVLYANEAYETITGRSRQSLTDNPKSYEELIHPEDRTHVLTKLEEATRTGQFNERFRIVNAHGEVHWVTVHGFPVRDTTGKIWRLVGTAQEITEQKRAEDQVEKTSRSPKRLGQKPRHCARQPWRSRRTCTWISLWMRYCAHSRS